MYFYQIISTSYEGGCTHEFNIPSSEFNESTELQYLFGSGLSGSIKSIYIFNLFHDTFAFSQFKNTFGQQRLNCFETDFNEDPFYVNPG